MTINGSTWTERADHFSNGKELLFGILTEPAGRARGVGVVLLNAGSWIPAMNRNGLWVKIARDAAADGYHVLRFDYHGVGESTGEVTAFQIDRSFERDVHAAVDHMKSCGVDRVILYGWCLGARLALHCAPDLEGVMGTVALSLPVVDSEAGLEGSSATHDIKRALNKQTLKRLFDARYRHVYFRIAKGRLHALREAIVSRFSGDGDARQWVSRGFLRDIKGTVKAGVPTLMVHGTEDIFYQQFRRASESSLAGVLASAGANNEVEVVQGEVHRLLSTGMQDVVLERTPRWLSWVEERARPTAATTGRLETNDGV